MNQPESRAMKLKEGPIPASLRPREFKLKSQFELLKTLEGYVVNNVAILYGLEGQVHVEISARLYGTMDTKTVSFDVVPTKEAS